MSLVAPCPRGDAGNAAAACSEARRRFLAERRILAGLEHPGIARLLDGGIIEDGTPYLVMENVRGEPVDAWCAARRLPLDARLDLFVRICDAVERVRTRLRGRPLLQARLLDAPGEAYQHWGLFPEVRRLLEEALAMRLRLLGPDHLEVADSRVHLGTLRYRLDDPDTDSLFAPAGATYRWRLGPWHPKTRDALTNYGIALRARADYDGAERLFREIVAARGDGSGRADAAARARGRPDRPERHR